MALTTAWMAANTGTPTVTSTTMCFSSRLLPRIQDIEIKEKKTYSDWNGATLKGYHQGVKCLLVKNFISRLANSKGCGVH
jgi:hypothetical protein